MREVLLLTIKDGLITPCGVATVPFDKEGKPIISLHAEHVPLPCGHAYWSLFAETPDEFTDELKEYVLWRGGYQTIGALVMEWLMTKVHEVPLH